MTGRVLGDESRYDSLRGGPDSGYGVSIWVGPLSALSYNRGLANEGGSAFQTNPPAFAAARLDDALEARGIAVRRSPSAGTAPRGLDVLASVDSPPMERIVKLMNKPSDNFFAEMLVKDIAMQADRRGTTVGGRRPDRRLRPQARRRRAPVDGSGLSRGQPGLALPRRAAADRHGAARRIRRAARLAADRRAATARSPTACARGPARAHCHAKTGTLSDVSALSGYCEARSGDVYGFSFLMNRISPTTPGASRTGWRRRWRRSASGAGGPRRRRPPRRASRRQQLQQALLVEHLGAELLRLGQLRARVLAGDQVVGLLRHRAGHLAAGRLDRSVASGARQVGQRPGEHERLAHQRALGGRRRALLLHAQPVARAAARPARACAPRPASRDTVRAMIGPMPSVSARAARRRPRSSASIERKWRARLRALT